MGAELGANRYGKAGIHLATVLRGDERHEFFERLVDVRLEGDFGAVHLEGDNASVLPTDTMRSSVYALAKDRLDEPIEAFALRYTAYLLDASPAVARAEAWITERPWDRVEVDGRAAPARVHPRCAPLDRARGSRSGGRRGVGRARRVLRAEDDRLGVQRLPPGSVHGPAGGRRSDPRDEARCRMAIHDHGRARLRGRTRGARRTPSSGPSRTTTRAIGAAHVVAHGHGGARDLPEHRGGRVLAAEPPSRGGRPDARSGSRTTARCSSSSTNRPDRSREPCGVRRSRPRRRRERFAPSGRRTGPRRTRPGEIADAERERYPG